jgi:hypothetical protein
MSRLEIILSAVLFVSIILNIGIFTYARAVLSKLLFVSEELGDLQIMTNSFAEHLASVYELETFYGDETLKVIYSLTEQEQPQDDTAETQDENQEETQ